LLLLFYLAHLEHPELMCVCVCVCVCAADGLKWLSNAFHLCHAMDSESKVQVLKDWLSGTWFNLAMGGWAQRLVISLLRAHAHTH